MVHRFTTTKEVAHTLSKIKKIHRFYFRALTRTDKDCCVFCETTEPGYEFINQNFGTSVIWENKNEQ